jgi:predicted transcriptional regulator
VDFTHLASFPLGLLAGCFTQQGRLICSLAKTPDGTDVQWNAIEAGRKTQRMQRIAAP